MSSADDRIREAFDALTLPPDVRAAALKAIEQKRTEEAAARAEETVANEPTEDEQAEQEPTRHEPRSDQAESPQPNNVRVVAAAPSLAQAQRRPKQAVAQARRTSRRRRKLPIAIAACLVAAVLGIGGGAAYATETAVVAIEVNPSLELGINCFDTVVAARALNDDGQALLDEVGVVGSSYEDAIAAITQASTVQNATSSGDIIDISIVCERDGQAASLTTASDNAIAATNAAGSCHRATVDEREQATAAGMSVGRYELACELVELDPDTTVEDCSDLTMREIADRIRAIDPDNETAAERCGGHGHGYGYGAASSDESASNGGGQGQDRGQGGSENAANGHGQGHSQGHRYGQG